MPKSNTRYDSQALEQKWRERWQRDHIYEIDVDGANKKFYNLMMFPYPSAEGLHVGNVYAFTGSDIYGRYMAMQGHDVFEPMGFDAFGIHSENFAIKMGVHPKILTEKNVTRFRETQLKQIGNRFDWTKEVNTTDPGYYRWTQWLFLQLFKAGLAVRKKAPVNWCPKDQTVLADEQVIDGRCERCGTQVVQRELEQWFFRITEYAQKLLDHLDHLDWSQTIKTAQRNWIGRSEGLEFELAVEGHPGTTIPVFTTRPDTIFGVTYVVLAPEHPLVPELTTPERRADVEAYRDEVRRKSELDRLSSASKTKTGAFLGTSAVNPINDERVPIWVADHVLVTYGTGAIMAVPAHDQRDLDFARAFGLEVRDVIVPADGEAPAPDRTEAYTDPGVLAQSGPFTGLPSPEAAEQIMQWFTARDLGRRTVNYRLRDWLISRQRYWGPPIPMIYCDGCGIVPVPDDQLPVLLPDVDEWMPTGTGSSPLAEVPSFVETTCPTCGKPARRETDVSDNFLDSGWYFLRYPSARDDEAPFDPSLTHKWLPVDMYIGGPEHSVLHLLYSRFLTMALHDIGHLEFDEPFARFRAHGHITKDGAKMSKSHGNVVNPDDFLDEYGADTLRIYLMFLGPYEQGGDFTDRGIVGAERFLHRMWDLVNNNRDSLVAGEPPEEVRRPLHRTIQKVRDDVGTLKYNTAIAALMEYLNLVQRRSEVYAAEVEAMLLLLAPFAPHLTEELWEQLGKPYSIHQQLLPTADPALLTEDVVTVAIQVNGRTRGRVELPPDAAEEEAVARAREVGAVQAQLDGRPLDRVIYVPGRIINFVLAPT